VTHPATLRQIPPPPGVSESTPPPLRHLLRRFSSTPPPEWRNPPGFEGKNFFSHKALSSTTRTPKMGDGGVFHTTCADFSRPVEELEYTCLLKSTFTEASHDRGFKTCQTPTTYPECLLWKNVSVGDGLRRMTHGPQHFECNNCPEGKGCHSVCRITINIA
jgi:hypothetical protein